MAGKKRIDKKGRILKDNEFQRPDGRYMYRYYDRNNKMHYVYAWKLVSTDKTPSGKREDISLREKIEQINADKIKGIYSFSNKKITLNEMFEKYIKNKSSLKQSTKTNYKYMYKKYVQKTLGNLRIVEIRFSDILTFYNSLINEKGFKPNSMETIHTILHPTFTLAVRDDLILRNPTDGAMKEIKNNHNWEKPKRHALTIKQQEVFMRFIKNSDIYSHWLPLFTVFLGTGCRVGEIIGLRVKDCDFTKENININHNLIYRQQDNGKCEMHITTPKTIAGIRNIPMFKEVKEALKAAINYQIQNGICTTKIDNYNGFIFTNRYGNVHNPQTINRAIKRIIKACNEQEIEQSRKERREPTLLPDFSVHNLRHTFCTRLCENESNIKVIQAIMGHTDVSTTMNIYAEATEDKNKEVFNNLEGKIKIC